MNLIVAFDSSDWVGAGLGKQTRPGHTQPQMHSAPRWVAATTGISPAQPGRVGRSAGLGAVGCVWLSSRWFGGRTRKNVIVLLNISLHSTWLQTPAVAGCRVKRAGLKNLVSSRVCLGKGESRLEGGFLATNVCSCSQICHLCISPSRGSPMPCRADTQWRWGPALGLNLFRQGVTASVRVFRRGGLTCRQRSAGGQRSKFRFGCGFWQSLVVVVSAFFRVVPTAVEARSGRVSGDARQDSPRRLVKGVHGKQRRWKLDKASAQVCWQYEALECEQWSPDTFLLSRYFIPPPKRRDGHPHRQWTLTVGWHSWPTVWKI